MNLEVAIPDSSLIDESTKVGKTRKVSVIARACAIFKVKQIFIYKDGDNNKNDSVLLSTLLKYLETPQYFRKQLFAKMKLLEYAGELQPLRISSHLTTPKPKMVKIDDIREGLIAIHKGKKIIDIGINRAIPYYGKEKPGIRVTIQITAIHPEFLIKEIPRENLNQYWGYKVKEKSNLFTLLSSWNGNIILTSKKGKIFTQSEAKKYENSEQNTLVVFGSPEKGIYEILGNNIKKVQNSKTFNFFPNQATETIRFEEALLGTLSILNILNTTAHSK